MAALAGMVAISDVGLEPVELLGSLTRTFTLVLLTGVEH